MSVSFCSGRPHSVRAPERLPREHLRHRDSLAHKQTNLCSHTLHIVSTLNGDTCFDRPAPGPKSFGSFQLSKPDSNPSGNLLNYIVRNELNKMGQTETGFLFLNATKKKKKEKNLQSENVPLA